MLTRALEGVVYGSKKPGPGDEGLKQAVSKLYAERRDQVSVTRRAIAVMTPWSWLRSR